MEHFDKDRTFVRAWGSFGTDPGQFATPQGVALDAAGNVYVNDDDGQRVDEFDPNGKLIRSVGDGAGGPFIAVTPDGHLYKSTGDYGRLLDYGPDGTLARTIDLSALGGFLTGLAVDGKGDIFVASETSGGACQPAPGQLVELDPSGKLLHLWPTGGEGIALDPNGDRVYLSYCDWKDVRSFALPKV